MGAPVALFAFNRPQHLARTLYALAQCPEAPTTHVYCFVDGPRTDKEAISVRQVLSLLHGAIGFFRVEVVQSTENKGLFTSITTGITSVLAREPRVIVLEDDMVVSPHFLSFMNEALDRYQGASQVGSIHGYSPPLPGLPDYYFLHGGDCWGWATWDDRWKLFDGDSRGHLRALFSKGLLDSFCSSHGNVSLLQLANQARGRTESWAICWHASLYLLGKLTLHPGLGFVANIGYDGSGVHSEVSCAYDSALRKDFPGLPCIETAPNFQAARAMSRFMDSGGRAGISGLWRRLFMWAYSRTMALAVLCRHWK